MKKPSRYRINRRGRKGAQLAEFERRDLGEDIRASRAGRLLRRRAKPTSILLDDGLVQKHRGMLHREKSAVIELRARHWS
jgi:hypothetical protein